MTSKGVTKVLDKDDNYESIELPYILASLECRIEEWEIKSFTVQQVDSNDFRCILRAYRRGPGADRLRYVSFTNGGTARECLANAEQGFSSGATRWHIDRYQPEPSKNGTADDTSKGNGLTFIQ